MPFPSPVHESEVAQSHQLLVTPWTAAYQAPPSMGFSTQQYWSGLPFPSPGDLPDPGIEPRSPALQAVLYHGSTWSKWGTKHSSSLTRTAQLLSGPDSPGPAHKPLCQLHPSETRRGAAASPGSCLLTRPRLYVHSLHQVGMIILKLKLSHVTFLFKSMRRRPFSAE